MVITNFKLVSSQADRREVGGTRLQGFRWHFLPS